MSTTAMKLALQRIPRTALISRTAVIASRPFSSAACALDEEAEREALYQGGSSPISEFFDLAVNHGHTNLGPPPKYKVSEAAILKCGISEDDLAFKSASYQQLIYAPYVQQGEHKVTMIVKWDVLPLNDFEKRILMEIVGSRYNETKKELKMTSNQFGSRIENKRHLTSMLDRVVFAARKLAAAAGTAESIVEAEE